MNQQALSAFIWSVADLLRGDYKPADYGKVILPFTVLRRLDCVLEATKADVLAEHALRTGAGLNPPVMHGWFDTALILRLGAAAVLGLLLGLDRELRGHAAGMRTHGLICFAAAAMTVSILALYLQLDGARMDPLRIFEATGAFIGIIGAGLIVFSKGEVRNLTTAAHLWLTAVIGIACGAGQWPLVVAASVIAVVVLTVLWFVEDRFFPETEKTTR